MAKLLWAVLSGGLHYCTFLCRFARLWTPLELVARDEVGKVGWWAYTLCAQITQLE